MRRALRRTVFWAGVMASLLPSVACAVVLPEGPALVAGTLDIFRADGARPVMTIRQQSPTAIANWQAFGIAPHATVTVEAALPDSLLINRVIGNEVSVIEGQLISNGSVWLINPNGINLVLGNNIDTRAFMTSSVDVDPRLLINATRAMLGAHVPVLVNVPADVADAVNVHYAMNAGHRLPVNPAPVAAQANDAARTAMMPDMPTVHRTGALDNGARSIVVSPLDPSVQPGGSPRVPEPSSADVESGRIASPTLPRYLLSPRASPLAHLLGSQRPHHVHQALTPDPISADRIFSWFASPAMSTPPGNIDPYSSDDSDY